MSTAPFSKPFLFATPAPLTPSWASTPSGFHPAEPAQAQPSDSLQLVMRRLRLAVMPRSSYKVVSSAKRTLDVAVSALALILLSPVLLGIALAIKLSDGGPVIFWQERVGLFGETFLFPKFRSMITQAEAMKSGLLSYNVHGDGVTFKMHKDPRVTRIGRLLRHYSLDELPQLWCVLKGEMSLVGPRPAIPQEVERYAAHHRNRLHTLPGLTCIWQVSGRSEIPFEQQVKLDAQYIETRNFWLDLSLLARTVPAVLSGRGAY